jgi:hypothetical protein
MIRREQPASFAFNKRFRSSVNLSLSRDAGAIRHGFNPRHEIHPQRTNSTIASLTAGVRWCQVVTSSRSATQSRHSSDRPWVHLAQSKAGE